MEERIIKKVGNQYCVFTKDGSKKLGCHPSKAEALKQLQAIEASKHAKGADGTSVRTFPAEVRQVGEEKDRTLQLIGTDETPDRYNTVIKADGWDLENFRKNPVFNWAHDVHATPPIGMVTKIEPVTRKNGVKAVAFNVKFADRETFPFADVIYRLFQKGFLRGTSVGFKTLKQREVIDDEARDLGFKDGRGVVLEKNELIELSAVPVPGNPNAVGSELEACAPEIRGFLKEREKEEPVEDWLSEQLERVRKLLDPRAVDEKMPPGYKPSKDVIDAASKHLGKGNPGNVDALVSWGQGAGYDSCKESLKDKEGIDNPYALCHWLVGGGAAAPGNAARSPEAPGAKPAADGIEPTDDNDDQQMMVSEMLDHAKLLVQMMEGLAAKLGMEAKGEGEPVVSDEDQELAAKKHKERFLSLLFGNFASKADVIGMQSQIVDLEKRLAESGRSGVKPQDQDRDYVELVFRENRETLTRIQRMLPT